MNDLMSIFYILEMVFGGATLILLGLMLLIAVPLAILSIYSKYKYLKLIGHPKPLLFLIPFYGMHVLGDTVVANGHSEVKIFKNFTVPKIVFAWMPLFSLVLGYIPFLGGIISLVISTVYLYVLGLDMLKRLKSTNNDADVQVLAIINIFTLGCIPLIMTLFRSKNAPFIQPQYSGMYNGGNVGTFAQFVDKLSKNNTSNNQYGQQNQWNQYSQPQSHNQWGNVQQQDYSNHVTPDNVNGDSSEQNLW